MEVVFSRVVLALLSLVAASTAASNSFTAMQLAEGISLDVPMHWHVVSAERRQNLQAASQAQLESNGIDAKAKTRSLLVVTSTPAPVTATIRVNIVNPATIKPEYLTKATPADLHELTQDMLRTLKPLEKSGLVITRMDAARIESMPSGKRALILSYQRRPKAPDQDVWQVNQYKMPVSREKMVELTLSYRLTDEGVMKPILDKVLGSFRF